MRSPNSPATSMNNPTAVVRKLWNYCNIFRDDGLSYGDYVEQLTFLLFLKMADDQSRPSFNSPSLGFGGTGKPSAVPKEFAWPSLLARDGDEFATASNWRVASRVCPTSHARLAAER